MGQLGDEVAVIRVGAQPSNPCYAIGSSRGFVRREVRAVVDWTFPRRDLSTSVGTRRVRSSEGW